MNNEELQKLKETTCQEYQLLISWLNGYCPILNGIVEIGVMRGDSARIWRSFLAPDGIYIGVDINLHDESQHLYAEVGKVAERYKDDKRMNFVIADSHNTDTVGKVKEVIGVAPIDFLFIDGEHSYEGTKIDFENYSPLVKSGGIIVYHDATRNSNVRRAIADVIDVYEFNVPFKHYCQFDSKQGHCGIVVLVKE